MSDYQERAKECKCCSKHVPLPTVLREFEGNTLCPTTFANVVEYTRIWNSIECRPPGHIRKHFSDFVQQIVEQQMKESIQ